MVWEKTYTWHKYLWTCHTLILFVRLRHYPVVAQCGSRDGADLFWTIHPWTQMPFTDLTSRHRHRLRPGSEGRPVFVRETTTYSAQQCMIRGPSGPGTHLGSAVPGVITATHSGVSSPFPPKPRHMGDRQQTTAPLLGGTGGATYPGGTHARPRTGGDETTYRVTLATLARRPV